MEKHTRTFTEDDGVVTVWEYDPNKNMNGPYEVTIKYPKDFLTKEQTAPSSNKTDKKYFNPANNKFVGYGRAKALGLI